MRWLVLGATGLLGPAFVKAIHARGEMAITAARRTADVLVDISDEEALKQVLDTNKPDGVINCAANIYVDKCEANPASAYLTNTRPLSTLADWSRANAAPLLQISTDHYFTTGDDALHDESAPVHLVNEYARSKYLAEHLALTSPHAIVLRTNIVGATKGHGKWVLDSLRSRSPMTLFMDFYASPIHINAMAANSLSLANRQAAGVFNMSSRNTASKGDFIYEVARFMNIDPDWVVEGSGQSLTTPRAMCLGLDVRKTESVLDHALPTLKDTAKALVEELG